jgi:hypothetical protein
MARGHLIDASTGAPAWGGEAGDMTYVADVYVENYGPKLE